MSQRVPDAFRRSSHGLKMKEQVECYQVRGGVFRGGGEQAGTRRQDKAQSWGPYRPKSSSLSPQPYEGQTAIPLLQIRRLRLRRGKRLGGHTAILGKS